MSVSKIATYAVTFLLDENNSPVEILGFEKSAYNIADQNIERHRISKSSLASMVSAINKLTAAQGGNDAGDK